MWSMLHETASRAILYTSLTYNVGAWALTSRDWYNYIDKNVILGAIPFFFLKEKLVQEESIGAVISLNMPYERQFITTPTEEWQELGVTHYKIDIPDFVSTPSVDQMWQGIKLIKEKESNGLKTYVHCKAGRSRSATLVAAYVMERYHKTVEEAVELVTEKRPHVKYSDLQLATLSEFSLTLEPADCAPDTDNIQTIVRQTVLAQTDTPPPTQTDNGQASNVSDDVSGR